MSEFIYNLFFLLVTLYIMIKSIFYGIYEINNNSNKSGGVTVIIVSILVVIFSNIMMFIK